MIFGPDHYVPVLKVKRGEKAAIAVLAPSLAAHFTPLFEVVEMKKTATNFQSHLTTAFKGFDVSVAGLRRYMLDTKEIAPAGPAAATDAFARARSIGVPFTPVTGIARTADVGAALAASGHGLALRLERQDFEKGGVAAGVNAFVKAHGLSMPQIDLVVDLGAVDHMVAAGVAHMARQFLSNLPQPKDWRTLSLIASAFPKSMGGVDRNSHAAADRAEWLAWRNLLYPGRAKLARLPTFGDWGIQHPLGVEGFDPQKMAASPSIRYALDAAWLLMKGESTRTKLAAVQYPPLAQKLVSGPLKGYFAGRAHCAGCEGAAMAASGAPKLGTMEVWRRLGTMHHITNTVRQIRALPWP